MAGYNLTGAVQNFLMGMEAKRGYDANKLLGTLMGGQGSQEDERKLAQLNPQMFSGYQKMQAQQQAAQQQQLVQQLFGAAASGDQQAMQQLAGLDQNAYMDLQKMIIEREKMNKPSSSTLPASIQETEWFNQQSPEIQATHLKLKRQEKPSFEEKIEYETELLKVENEAARQKETNKTEVERLQGYVDTGVQMADNLTTVNRSLQLLESVGTGGLDQALIKGKRMLGIESADEAELSYELGKAVMRQLKPTFGAAFTAKEAEMLMNLESGLGKSAEGNIRILRNMQEVVDRAANRGLRAAKELGLKFDAGEIQIALDGAKNVFESQEQPKVEVLNIQRYSPDQQQIMKQLLDAGATEQEILDFMNKGAANGF